MIVFRTFWIIWTGQHVLDDEDCAAILTRAPERDRSFRAHIVSVVRKKLYQAMEGARRCQIAHHHQRALARSSIGIRDRWLKCGQDGVGVDCQAERPYSIANAGADQAI